MNNFRGFFRVSHDLHHGETIISKTESQSPTPFLFKEMNAYHF